DNDIVQFVISAVTQMENIMAAARQYRKVILEGELGEATPSWPAQFAGTLPVPAVPTGIYERLDAMVKRIRSSPNYTKETGALLGIIPAKSDPVSPDLMKPQPSLTALPGNRVQVSFTRGTTNGIAVEMQVDNSGSW